MNLPISGDIPTPALPFQHIIETPHLKEKYNNKIPNNLQNSYAVTVLT